MPVSAEHRHANSPPIDVLPLVSVGMPVQLPQRARLELEQRTGDGLGEREEELSTWPETCHAQLPQARNWRFVFAQCSGNRAIAACFR